MRAAISRMHFDRAHIRLLIAEIGIPLLFVALLDVAFGWYAARTASVPLPQLFGSPTTAGKFLAFRQATRRQHAFDVMFMGMSQMMRVNGQALRETLGAHAERPVAVFNFAGPYHSFALDQRLLLNIVLPLAKPAVVVYGVTPLALLNEPRSAAAIEMVTDRRPVFSMYTGGLAARLGGFALMHVSLLRYREVIRDALMRGGWKADPFGQQARAATDSGDVPLLTAHKPVVALNALERRNRQQFANFDNVMRETRLFSNLIDFASFCAAHDIELVVLNHPVHPLFLQLLPYARADYDRYLTALRRTAQRAHVRFFEPIPDGVGSPDLFQDTVHHNTAGGEWLTAEVGRYLMENGLVAK